MATEFFRAPEANAIFDGLKKKHKNFILSYLKDFNGARAYREAIAPNDEYAKNHASRLLALDDFKKLLEYYYAQEAVSKTELISNLKSRINDPTRSGREQLASIKLLAQISGWLEPKEVAQPPTVINIVRGPIQGPTSA